MSANPSKDLNLDEEIRDVRMAIQSYAKHDVEMIHQPAVRLEDMINLLNSEQPHILHFAGHGYAESGELYMVDDDTKGDKIIPSEALSLLFDSVKGGNLKLVFLNSCYSKVQADAILESIDYVIGMNDEIADDSAKTFSTQFYSSFVAGVSLINSFKQAKAKVTEKYPSQKNIPELLTRSDDVKDFSIVDIVGEKEKKSKSTIPNQLTSKLGKDTIIGREKELNEIDNLLKTNNSLLLINGIGGVGKSTIASFYLHSHKEQFDYYGFFEGLDSFTNELKVRLNLKSQKPNELFLEALSRLSTLEGEKLLVLDDIKDIEENQAYIDGILALKEFGYKILITSREEIDEEIVKPYYLDVLSLADAKALFNSIHEVEDEAVLEEILGYLGYHAFFVEKTAHSIKKTLTAKMIRDKFREGEFAQISVKRKHGFDRFLNQLFTLDGLDKEETLMLKQLSALPSIEIDFKNLEYIFQKKEDSEFEELLDFLSEKGWLTKLEGGYKLHQIIKEYLLANHKPTFEEIEVVVDSLNYLIRNSADAQVAVDNRENIIYFESLVMLLERLGIENEKVGDFFERFGNIYYYLGLYQKAESLLSKALKIREKILGEEHPDTATSYNNLAVLYKSMGEYQKAEPLYLKALKIREKVLGEEHPSTATSYNNLAVFYYGQGDYKRAYEFMKRAVEVWSKVLPEGHPNLVNAKKALEIIEGRL